MGECLPEGDYFCRAVNGVLLIVPAPPAVNDDLYRPRGLVWGPLAQLVDDARGLAIRQTAHSYTTSAVAQVLAWAGRLAAERGGRLQVADVSRSSFGVPFPPHKSHRFGVDADVGYTLDRYPTPLTTAASPSFAWLLCQLRPYLDRVFVSTARRDQLLALAQLQSCQLPTLVVWPGHQTHAHLRFRSSLPLGGPDDDGDDWAQDYFLPDWYDDSGWEGPTDGYPFVRATLQAFLDSPEPLQRGPVGRASPASLTLAARAYEWFRQLRAPGWPPIAVACADPGSDPCNWYRWAVGYFYSHEYED
jgi:hypothetical protein